MDTQTVANVLKKVPGIQNAHLGGGEREGYLVVYAEAERDAPFPSDGLADINDAMAWVARKAGVLDVISDATYTAIAVPEGGFSPMQVATLKQGLSSITPLLKGEGVDL
jgi:hypothetical protein